MTLAKKTKAIARRILAEHIVWKFQVCGVIDARKPSKECGILGVMGQNWEAAQDTFIYEREGIFRGQATVGADGAQHVTHFEALGVPQLPPFDCQPVADGNCIGVNEALHPLAIVHGEHGPTLVATYNANPEKDKGTPLWNVMMLPQSQIPPGIWIEAEQALGLLEQNAGALRESYADED